MKHLSYRQFKDIFGDLGLTNWVRFNWLGWLYIDGTKLNVKEFQENYSLLEYVESDGTQYIDTVVVGTLATAFKIKAKNKSATQTKNLFGSRTSASSNAVTAFTDNVNPNDLIVDFGSYTETRLSGTVGTDIFEVYNSKNYRYINDTSSSDTYSSTIETPSNLLLFDCYQAPAANKWVGQVFYCKIYVSDVLKRYFIPAKRKSDNEVGMYDLANGVFYTNAGTGDFIAGDVIA